jgi:hypothetical protein
MKQFKTRILQKMADSIILHMSRASDNEMLLDTLMRLGIWVDSYAVQHDIWLD